jgi:L-lactate utilization protein LutC
VYIIYFRPQGEVAPSQEVEFHSRPASILVNLPITNTIHEQESKAEETINVDQLDDLLQTLETIQENIMTQNHKVARRELQKVLTLLVQNCNFLDYLGGSYLTGKLAS